jgi:hypothetical protein
VNLEQLLRWLTLRGLLVWYYLGTRGEGGTICTYTCSREELPELTWRTRDQSGRMVAVALDVRYDQHTVTLTSGPIHIPGIHYLGLYTTYLELRLSIETMDLGLPDVGPAAKASSVPERLDH